MDWILDYLTKSDRINMVLSQTWGRVSKADIGTPDRIDHQFESRPRPNLFGQIIGTLERVVDEVLEVSITSGLEHEPGLEGVDLTAALHRHVAGVVIDVVKLVLLKKK